MSDKLSDVAAIGYYVIPTADNPDQSSLWDGDIHPTTEHAQAGLDKARPEWGQHAEFYRVVALVDPDLLESLSARVTQAETTVSEECIRIIHEQASINDYGHVMTDAEDLQDRIRERFPASPGTGNEASDGS